MSPYLTTSILAGLLALENRSSLKLLISQPICGGLLTGFLLGSVAEGFAAGTLMQVIFLGSVSIRGGRVPDVPMGGVAASALFILAGRDYAGGMQSKLMLLPWSVFTGIAVAALGQYVYDFWGKFSGRLTSLAFTSIREGRFGRVSAIHLSILLIHFSYGFLVILVTVPAARAISDWAGLKFPQTGGDYLAAFHLALPFIGIGSLLRLQRSGMQALLFTGGFLLTILIVFIRS